MMIEVVTAWLERRRAVGHEAASLIASHGEDAGLIASHLATHPGLPPERRKHWDRLARMIGREAGHSWRFRMPASRLSANSR